MNEPQEHGEKPTGIIERKPALIIQDLEHRFGHQTAISGINLQVHKGEIVSLLGPSGCGKTTTLRCVAGFYRPHGGTITVGNRLIASPEVFVPPEERNLAMVFQNYVLWPHMRAFDNVAYGLRLRGIRRDEISRRVHDIMAVLGLGGLEKRYPHELSGGQQQRLSVARSLVVEPEVLLLDEPFSNLDAKLRVEIRQEMRSLLKRFGTTAVYVTHDQEEAMALSDRIILMHGGRIVQEGTPLELFQWPESKFTAQFFGIPNFLPGKLENGSSGPRFVADGIGVTVPLDLHDIQGQAAVRMELAVRENGIEVAPTRGAGEGWFEGVVTSRTYLGGVVHLVIACKEGLALQARIEGSVALEWPDRVAVRIKPEHTILLPLADERP